jgi:3',5'-cyclic-AMP phosphodiesterase
MGHTHYNEIANDGRTLYAATRSTGQIEEGPVGFSLTNLDRTVVSWKFNPMGNWPFAMITSPADERMIIRPENANQLIRREAELHVKVWSDPEILSVTYTIDDRREKRSLKRVADTALWAGPFGPLAGTRPNLKTEGIRSVWRLRMRQEKYVAPQRQFGDNSNAVGAWPEKGILGTQLGPNKNGRKW